MTWSSRVRVESQ